MGAIRKASISSTNNLNFSCDKQTPTLEKLIRDLTLQSDNAVNLWCKTIQFLAIIFGWNEVIFTQQSQVHLRPPHHKSTKGFIQTMSQLDIRSSLQET